ncbi:hypothetical protein [Streptomyces sp. NPDC053755]|uniref:hypothetical protein n=1 Tax=Streptomyces sp. NPDC053755 TaxID=3155815 RepID=UPI00343191A4
MFYARWVRASVTGVAAGMLLSAAPVTAQALTPQAPGSPPRPAQAAGEFGSATQSPGAWPYAPWLLEQARQSRTAIGPEGVAAGPWAALRALWSAVAPEPGDPSPPSMDMPASPPGEQPEVQNSDPCGAGGTNPSGCGAREGNQKEIEDCPPGTAGCLAKYATDGQATQTDLTSTATFVDMLANKDRFASPQQASAQMCGIFSQHISFYGPDQYQFQPTTSNCLSGQSAEDNEQPTVTPVGTLTRLPSDPPQ